MWLNTPGAIYFDTKYDVWEIDHEREKKAGFKYSVEFK